MVVDVVVCCVEAVVGCGLLLQDDDDKRDVAGLVGKRKALQGHGGASSKVARATTSEVAERDMFPISMVGTIGM